jgi:hypothetical protein
MLLAIVVIGRLIVGLSRLSDSSSEVPAPPPRAWNYSIDQMQSACTDAGCSGGSQRNDGRPWFQPGGTPAPNRPDAFPRSINGRLDDRPKYVLPGGPNAPGNNGPSTNAPAPAPPGPFR